MTNKASLPGSVAHSTINLNGSLSMPRLHLGVYCTSGKETVNAVTYALEAGYRAFDSAEWYGNEYEVGSTIVTYLKSEKNREGLKREDIWFTTKLKTNTSYDQTRRKIKESIRKSGLDYLDLYLLHSPYGGAQRRKECWRAVVDAVDDGEVKAGGVSNYGVKHLKELIDDDAIHYKPIINQIELHPFNTQLAISEYCNEHRITLQAYAPLARAMRMSHPTLVSLAKKHGKSPAQVLLRWSLQKGYVPLPKSVRKERVVENSWERVMGGEEWTLSKEEMEKLDGCDEGLVTDWDPTDAD